MPGLTLTAPAPPGAFDGAFTHTAIGGGQPPPVVRPAPWQDSDPSAKIDYSDGGGGR